MITEKVLEKNHAIGQLGRRAGIILDRAIDWLVYLAMGLLVFSWLSVSADVVLRYFFSMPLQWSNEITEYILLQVTFLGTAYLLKNEGHVNVDIVLTRFRPRGRAMLNLVTTCVCILICIILTYYGITVVHDLIRKHTIIPKQIDMSAYIVYIVIPLGYFMLFCQFVRRAWRFFSIWRSAGKSKPETQGGRAVI